MDAKQTKVIKAAKAMGVPRVKANPAEAHAAKIVLSAWLRDVQQVIGAWKLQRNNVNASEVTTAVRRWQQTFKKFIQQHPGYENAAHEVLGAEMSLGNRRGEDYTFALKVRDGIQQLLAQIS